MAADPSLTTWLLIAAAIWGAGAIICMVAPSRRLDGAVLAVALSGMAAHQVLLLGADKLSTAKSSATLAQHIKPLLTDSTRIYSVQTYPQSLPFYIGRTLTLVNFRGEFDFGLIREPKKGIPMVETFVERWTRETDAVAVMPRATYAALVSAGVPMTLITEDAIRVAVRR